jgi:hypothetical protein
MRIVLPGRPESRRGAVAVGLWEGRRIIAYVSGNAFAVLSDATTLVQTVYDDNPEPLQAIAVDEGSGRLAACTSQVVRIYGPVAQSDDSYQVGCIACRA